MGPDDGIGFRILGAIEAEVAGERLPLGRGKPLALLALLLLRTGRVVLADELIDQLWGGHPPPSAAGALQVHVSRLRKLLPAGTLVTEGGGYRLGVEPERIDAHRFERLVADGQAALARGQAETAGRLLDEALGLWRGPVLADVAYESFAQPEIARLGELRLVAVEERVAAGLARGRARELVGELEALVAEHPLRERLRAQLMLALYRAGRQADALGAYRAAREALVDELGIEPGAELRELHQRILEQDPDLAGPGAPAIAHPDIPVPLTSFVGRERELAEIGELLLAARLVTLTGAGGCGKTRLTLELAGRLAGDFPDGIWIVELAPVGDPLLVSHAVSSVLGVQEEPGRPLLDSIKDFLRGRRALVVLDNCEHVVDAGADAAESLLQSCPELAMVATSRQPLGIAGETTYRVPPLPGPDAARLFTERARAVAPGFAPTGDEAPAVERVCARLDGIPLAIELAAARVRVLTPRQIEARLDDRFALLTGGSRTALPRQQTLQALVDWSYALLDDRERIVLDRLSVFAGAFDLEAAEAVVAGDGVTAPEVLDLLTGLADKSLVLAARDGERPRFRLLETIRQYAADRLREAGDDADSRRRHAEFFCSAAAAATPRLAGPDRTATLDALEGDAANHRAALGWEVESAPARALEHAGHLGWFWYHRGRFGEGRSWLERSIADPANQGGSRVRALALTAAARLAYYDEDFPAARVLADEAVELARRHGGPADVGYALYVLGNVLEAQEDPRAIVVDQEAVEQLRRTEDRWGLGLALLYLGSVATLAGRGEVAEPALVESRGIFTELGDDWSLAGCQFFLGMLAREAGDMAAGRALFEETVASMRACGDRWRLASALGTLAESYIAEAEAGAGDRSDAAARAREIWVEALGLRSNLGLRAGMAHAYEGLARVALFEGEPARAARILGAADRLDDAARSPVFQRREDHERVTTALREELGEPAWAAEWSAGRAMTDDEALRFAGEPAAVSAP